MAHEKELAQRSGNICELCGDANDLRTYIVPPTEGKNADECVYACGTCADQLTGEAPMDPNHWRCLNDSMWSEVPAVKVLAFRILTELQGEGWPADLLEMIYLDDETMTWAKATMEDPDAIKHFDSNGVQLKSGDSVVLIKDLDVKGSSMVAKRGTAVRNIRCVHNDPTLIEGKVNGQTIYILTQYVKK